jgi:hypothetical protein
VTFEPHAHIVPMDPTDLEAIVVLLEIAAILLTDSPESRFTEAELFARARELGGDECPINERDMRIVFTHMRSIIKKRGRDCYQLC